MVKEECLKLVVFSQNTCYPVPYRISHFTQFQAIWCLNHFPIQWVGSE